MKKLIIFSIILFIFCYKSYADVGENQFGIGYSTISGGGLSYQGELNPNLYLMINAFPYYFGQDPPNDLDIYINTGAELQFDLWDLNENRLYFFTGASYYYIELRSSSTQIVNDVQITEVDKHIDRIINYGAGIGYEYIWLKAVAFSVGIGIQGQQSGITDRISSFFDRNPEGENFWGIGASVGIRYAFP